MLGTSVAVEKCHTACQPRSSPAMKSGPCPGLRSTKADAVVARRPALSLLALPPEDCAAGDPERRLNLRGTDRLSGPGLSASEGSRIEQVTRRWSARPRLKEYRTFLRMRLWLGERRRTSARFSGAVGISVPALATRSSPVRRRCQPLSSWRRTASFSSKYPPFLSAA
jgi:hypothetical protein